MFYHLFKDVVDIDSRNGFLLRLLNLEYEIRADRSVIDLFV